MSKALVVGLDFGTSGLKGAAWNAQGVQVADALAKYASYDVPNGGVEQQPEQWWQATQTVMWELVKKTQGRGQIVAIGLSGPIGNIVCLDANGVPIVASVPIWQDRRAAVVLADVARDFSDEELDDWLGIHLPAGPNWPIPRFRWLAQAHPEVLAQTRWVAQTKDYIGWRLTSKWVTDASSWRGLVHLPEGQSVSRIMAYVGLPESVLPERQAPDASRGKVIPAIADELGLDEGVLVSTGWNDLNSAAMGASLTLGEGFDLAGTSDHFGVVIPDISVKEPRLTVAPYVTGQQLFYGVTATSGGSLAWLKENWFDSTEDSWHTRLTQAAEELPGSMGLMFLPHLAGERAPFWDAHARGAFIGLTRAHRLHHGLSAVMEGVAFHLSMIQGILSDHGHRVDYIKAAGGPMVIEPWNPIRADVLGVPVWIAEDPQVGCRGAAILASGLAGIDPERLHCSWRIMEPDRSRHEAYQAWQAIYLELYPRLRDVFSRLSRLAQASGPRPEMADQGSVLGRGHS